MSYLKDLNTFFDSGIRGASVSESLDGDKQSRLTSTNARATPKCVGKTYLEIEMIVLNPCFNVIIAIEFLGFTGFPPAVKDAAVDVRFF